MLLARCRFVIAFRVLTNAGKAYELMHLARSRPSLPMIRNVLITPIRAFNVTFVTEGKCLRTDAPILVRGHPYLRS